MSTGFKIPERCLLVQAALYVDAGRIPIADEIYLSAPDRVADVRLYDWLLTSPAYLSLSCPARALLIEVTRLYKGGNNGQLGLSVRRASERCNIARGTAQRAFAELQERQFIELVTKGAFSRKSPHASEWRLTSVACNVTGELASKAFMRWGREEQNAVSKYPVAVSNQIHRAA